MKFLTSYHIILAFAAISPEHILLLWSLVSIMVLSYSRFPLIPNEQVNEWAGEDALDAIL